MTPKSKTKTEKKPAKSAAPKKTAAAKPATPKAAKTVAPAEDAEAADAAKAPITNDMIAERAYQIWLAAGRPHGQETAIWLRAEEELRKANAGPR